jgi:hypothetical protein
MLMNADTFEWFKYRYNLEDSQVMKKYVQACMRIAPSRHGSQTRLPIRLRFDHAVLHDAVPHGHQREVRHVEKTPRQGVMAARRCTTAAGVSEGGLKQHKTTCGDAFTVVNCSDYRLGALHVLDQKAAYQK